MKASDILIKAAGHLSDRAVTYDKPDGERSMAKTVAAFNAIYDLGMTEVQGWHFMELLKMVRSSQGDFKSDNFEDGAAYAALAGESAYNSKSVKSDEENHDESEIPYVIIEGAPHWANWASREKDGSFYLYQDKPVLRSEIWINDACSSFIAYEIDGDISVEKFENSLRRVYRSQEEADKANGKLAG